MTANPQDFAYWSRGELPTPNKGTASTVGFDYWRSGEMYPAAISTAVTGQPKVYLAGVWVKKPVKVYLGGVWVAKPMKRYTGSVWVAV